MSFEFNLSAGSLPECMRRSASCSVPEVVLIGYGGAIGAVLHVEDLLSHYVELKLQGKATHHWRMTRDFYLVCSAIGVPNFIRFLTISPEATGNTTLQRMSSDSLLATIPTYYRLWHTATLRLRCMWAWHAL